MDTKDDLSMYEILHIISAGDYARTSLLDGRTIRKESKRLKEPLSLIKNAAKININDLFPPKII